MNCEAIHRDHLMFVLKVYVEPLTIFFRANRREMVPSGSQYLQIILFRFRVFLFFKLAVASCTKSIIVNLMEENQSELVLLFGDFTFHADNTYTIRPSFRIYTMTYFIAQVNVFTVKLVLSNECSYFLYIYK